jgi:ribonuclease HI
MQSIADFALPAYAPFVRGDTLKAVREVEKEAAMHIGGTVPRTRLTAIYGEAGLHPIDRRAQLSSANMYERLRRMPESNPARAMAERPPPEPQGARHTAGWRRLAQETVAAAEVDGLPREPIPLHGAESDAARAVPKKLPNFVPELVEHVTRQDSKEKRRNAAEKTLATLPDPDVRVYTDGSVLRPERVRDGGGGYFLVDAAGEEHRGQCAAGRVCDSYRAELHALRHALTTLADGDADKIAVPRGAEIQMLTDSQSAIRALEGGPWRQRHGLGQQIWRELCRVCDRHDAHVTIVYIPGHADIAGNESADDEAREAARAARAAPGGDPTPIPYPLARTLVRAHGRRQAWAAVEKDSHWWQVTQGRAPQWPRGLTRGQERVIAQLRAGKCPIVAEYLHLIKEADSPRCPQCPAPVEDVHHLICECPAYGKPRLDLFALEKACDLTILARRPARVMAFLRAIRREGCAAPKRSAAPEEPQTHINAAPRGTHGEPAAKLGRAC